MPETQCNSVPVLELSEVIQINGEAASDQSGNPVSSAGDVNGDGVDDVIIGAYQAAPNGKSNAGKSYLVFGKAGGWSNPLGLSSLTGSNGVIINGEAADDYSGRSVSSAGDVNGDGVDDILIGAYLADPNGKSNAGKSYLVFGKRNGWSSPLELSSLNGSNGVIINGEAADDYSGRSVSSVGDVNGDGVDDVVIGAYSADPNGKEVAGKSYLVFGKRGGWSSPLELNSLNGSTGVIINGENAGDWSGISVSGAGDVNGDGLDDVIIGAEWADPNGKAYAGKSYLVFGKANGWNSLLELSSLNGSNGVIFHGEAGGDWSGAPVSSAGDMNGDGIGDVIIGASAANPNGKSLAGRNYLVFGKASGWSSPLELSNLNGSTGVIINGEKSLTSVTSSSGGSPVSSAGDVNGDGLDDVIIGVSGADANGKAYAGKSYLVFGKAGGWSSPLELGSLNGSNGVIINGENASDWSGRGVSGAGDVNGDGVDDIIIGATGADPSGKVSAGKSYVLLGSSSITFNANLLTIIEGQIFRLTSSNLNATDKIHPPASLNFQIQNLQHGQFQRVNTSSPILGFTQQQVWNQQVQFSHDGTKSAPSYQIQAGLADYGFHLPFTCTQAATIFFNSYPSLLANTLTISNQGDTVVLTAANLNATDNETPLDDLEFTASSVQHGRFEYVSSPGLVITQFNQAEVRNQQVVFIQDNTANLPRYNITVSDGQLTEGPQAANVVINNYRPVLVNNRLVINQGQVITISFNNLGATDQNTPAEDIQLSVNNVTHGRFERVGHTGVAIENFSQQDITLQNILFAHDNSLQAPYYQVTVSDGVLSDGPYAGNIAFNTLPVLDSNELRLNRGETVVLTAANLKTTDLETPADELEFIASNVHNGRFETEVNPGIELTNFIQRQVTQGEIQFVHDGSDVSPGYQMAVSDGAVTTTPQEGNIVFNRNANATADSNSGLIAGSVVGGVAALAAGLGFWRYRRGSQLAQQRQERHLLADAVRSCLQLSNFEDFDSDQGLVYVNAMQVVAGELINQGLDLNQMLAAEIKQELAPSVAQAIRQHVPVNEVYFGWKNSVNPADIQAQARAIAESTRQLTSETQLGIKYSGMALNGHMG